MVCNIVENDVYLYSVSQNISALFVLLSIILPPLANLIISYLGAKIYVLPEVFIQQFAVGFAFPGDAEGVVASEVDEPFAWDDLGVMGFGDA